MSGSPYKKPQSSSLQLAKNRLASVSNPAHTSEEVERLKVYKMVILQLLRYFMRVSSLICTNVDWNEVIIFRATTLLTPA